MNLRRFAGIIVAVVVLLSPLYVVQPPPPPASVLSSEVLSGPAIGAPTIPPTQSTITFRDRLAISPVTTSSQPTATIPAAETSTTTTYVTTTAAPVAAAEGEATTTTIAGTTTTVAPTTTTTAAPSGGFHSGHESTFASSINGLRSNNGLGQLSRTGSLDAEARAWSKTMAQGAGLGHSGIGRIVPPWSAAGENVGYGPSTTAIFNALKASPTHLNNMLGSYTNFGIGVWVDSNGVVWTTHVFTR